MAATAEPVRLLNAGEACKYIGIDRSYLSRLNKAGKGPAPTVVGRRKMYRVEDIEAWLDSRRRGPHRIDRLIKALVDEFPPLNEQQKTAIRALLNTAA